MRIIAAYLLAVLGGNQNPNAAAVKKILDSVGASADEAELAKVVASLNGKDIDALIAEGKTKLAAIPQGGGGGGAAAAASAAAAGVDVSAGVIDGATDAPTGAEAQPEGEAGDRSATKPTPFAVPEGTVFFDAIPVLAYNLTNAPLPEGYALPPDSSGDGRYKQLCHGFTSAEYARYRRLVPRHRRQVGNPSHPLTPRAEFSMTRRAFRDLVFQWRQDLHRWDTITSADEAFAEGLPTMLEAGWEPEEETNEVALRALIRDAHRTLGHSEDEIRQLGLLEDDDNDEDDNDGPTAASAAAAVAPAAPPAPAAG